MRMHMYRGSHLPILMKLVSLTTGSILELGCGMYSTTYLHWACYPTKRRLVTYEQNPAYFPFAQLSIADFHEVHCIDNYGIIDLSEPWSIAFVDHDQTLNLRSNEIKRLIHADYVVAHDTERRVARKYGYTEIYDLFKYRWQYVDARPNTSVFSNKHDLRDFTVI